MAPKKLTLTSKALQALLTRIGSASSGTKSALLQRFQRNLPRAYDFDTHAEKKGAQLAARGRKIRVVSIDMGIKNLAFCDAEVTYPSSDAEVQHNHSASMTVLRWKKLDLVRGQDSAPDTPTDTAAPEDDTDAFSPPFLSRTAYKLITEEVLSVDPDVVLIEKQRWRSGGSSAVQQWTVRVNTLEAMLWAVLETLKRTQARKQFSVRAVDPKRVGQYWLGQHARALAERDNVDGNMTEKERDDVDGNMDEKEQEKHTAPSKPLARAKAEKSAKIAILRSWLVEGSMSTCPSTPLRTPLIGLSISPGAESTRLALLPRAKAKKGVRGAVGDVEMKKLDDVADCFLQAAAWVAWEANRRQLLGVHGGGDVDEGRILNMVEEIGGV